MLFRSPGLKLRGMQQDLDYLEAFRIGTHLHQDRLDELRIETLPQLTKQEDERVDFAMHNCIVERSVTELICH